MTSDNMISNPNAVFDNKNFISPSKHEINTLSGSFNNKQNVVWSLKLT